MEQIMAADIRDMVSIDRDKARKIARTLNTYAAKCRVDIWELSLEPTGFYLDGWNKQGKEVCHHRIAVE